MPTSLAAITPICGRFRPEVGMTARSALRLPCRRRHGYRLLHVAGRLAFSGRRAKLHLQDTWPWAAELVAAFEKLKLVAAATG
jgi:hypothetical protein